MGRIAKEPESKLALVLALHLLEVHSSDEIAHVLGEVTIGERISDVIDIPRPMCDFVGDWTYTYNCVLIPSCCAGECSECELQSVGYIDIVTGDGGRTYRMSLDALTAVENWEII